MDPIEGIVVTLALSKVFAFRVQISSQLEHFKLMSFDLKQIESIDKGRQLSVSGYIHEQEKNCKIHIPQGLILLCILFYGNDVDEWDPEFVGKFMQLSNRTITNNSWSMSCAYCKRIIKCGRFQWKFRIDECGNGSMFDGKFMIGIWKIKDKKPLTNTYFTVGGNQGYGFDPCDTVLTEKESGRTIGRKYGTQCKNGTIIEMILDLNDLTLRYIMDGVDYGKAFDVERCEYRAAVYLMADGDSITLLE